MATTPVQEVPQASVEDRLAAAFERAGMKDDPEPRDEPESEPEEEAQASAETDDESEAQAQTDESEEEADGEEVEFEGKAYKLPKPLKDAVLRQKDYTQKTQQVAEERRSLEIKAETIKAEAEFHKENFDKVVQAHALNAQLQQYAQVKWAELANADPAQYLVLDRQQRELQEAANRLNAELQQAGQSFQQKRTELKQKAQAKCIEELKRDFKDFGPELLKSLDDTGKSFGFTGEELASIADPRMVRVLHAAMQYKKLQGSKSLVEKKVQDARPVQVRSSRSAPTTHANAQLQQLRDQSKKTGKTADTEAYLAKLFEKRMR